MAVARAYPELVEVSKYRALSPPKRIPERAAHVLALRSERQRGSAVPTPVLNLVGAMVRAGQLGG
ncbi:MAG: hypothetical protein H6983_09195 [Ectothiorhodospiraceae bacterium]|nr:hypothetical protein [Chromatiales bacterium]MCP5151796.1 hypothetical protein [Chromatiales bacterium]MCP5154327.1 hypothetical protein [Ectothiorhodospiraceae bacterium]